MANDVQTAYRSRLETSARAISSDQQSRLRSRGRRRQLAVVFLGLTALLANRAARADTFDVVTKLQDTSASTVWRIDEPNVKQPATSYQQIKFVPGDRISVDAGGCVQTGGHGRTWKRYVNPSGPNADRLYHGLIHIPGVTAKLTRLQQFGLKADHQISDPLPSGVNAADLFLRLGYEDDGYGDNGYYSHDDGTEDQCKNVDHAFVIIAIGHDGSLPPRPASLSASSLPISVARRLGRSTISTLPP